MKDRNIAQEGDDAFIEIAAGMEDIGNCFYALVLGVSCLLPSKSIKFIDVNPMREIIASLLCDTFSVEIYQ